MKIKSLAMALLCSVCAGVMLIGCSSDDPAFVKKPNVSLSRTEEGDGEDARWYVEGKEMSRETFEAEVVGNAWMDSDVWIIEEDGSLAENYYMGFYGLFYYFDTDKIYVVGGYPDHMILFEYEYEIGDPVGYLPNNMLPIEINDDGMLTAIDHMPQYYNDRGEPERRFDSYKRLSKISKDDFEQLVETAKEDMKRNHQL